MSKKYYYYPPWHNPAFQDVCRKPASRVSLSSHYSRLWWGLAKRGLLQNTIQIGKMLCYTQILHLWCNQSSKGEFLIFITFPANTAVEEYHYPTWALLLFVVTLNPTLIKSLLRNQRTLIHMTLKTSDRKANEATKQNQKSFADH